MSDEDPMAELRRWSEQLKALPEPIAYIVLDHAMPTVSYIDDHDARGRRYVQVTPAVLDECRHAKGPFGLDVLTHDSVAPGLLGIPVYRREDMAEGWPDA